MFAIPFTASLSPALGHQLLGRFWPRPAFGLGTAAAPAASEVTDGDAEEDAIPDLAQRVREVGEW
jgi:hypothetical protein